MAHVVSFSGEIWRQAHTHRWRWPFPVLSGWRWAVLLPGLLLALSAGVLRLALILRYPLLYDGDAYGRWLNRAAPFNSPWVPLFQLCLYVLTRLADSILAVRLLSALFAVSAVMAFWLLLCRTFGPASAYLGALALALHPLFVVFSIVPYQEGLFFTLSYLALWLFLAPGEPRWWWLALLVGLASLTRYEGWLLALLLWLLLLWRRWRAGPLRWRFIVGSALALAWAPLLWVAGLRNVSPTGWQTLAPTLDPLSLLVTLRTLWPVWSLNLGLFGGALVLGGFCWLGWRATHGSHLARLFLAFLIGDVLLIAFLRPFSPGNLRLPLLSLPVVLTGISGLLVDGARFLWLRLPRQSRWLEKKLWLPGSLLALLTALLIFWLVPQGISRVAEYNALVRPAYLAAKEVPRSLLRGAVIAEIGPDTQVSAFQVYARQAGWQGQVIELAPAVLSTPDALAAALCQSQARLFVSYAASASSAGALALMETGILLPVGAGPGYRLWLVQSETYTHVYFWRAAIKSS